MQDLLETGGLLRMEWTRRLPGLLVRKNAEAAATICPALLCDVPATSLTAQSKAKVRGLFIPAFLFIHLLFMHIPSVYIVYIINHVYSHTPA